MPSLATGEIRTEAKRSYMSIIGLYLFIYYGTGSFFPLMAQYYQSIGLSGTQIGTISSITPIISIFAQPIWGMLCDKLRVRRPILMLALLASSAISLLFTQISTFAWVVVVFSLFSLFQCAVIPINDSIALNFAKQQNMQFGNLRLWGSVGYAIATLITGYAIRSWGPHAIFFFFAAATVLAIVFLRGLSDEGDNVKVNGNIFNGIGELVRMPRFVLFLMGAFFIFGPINANNTWFSLYYEHIGGTVVGIGVAFLLFAGSEAPFMKVAGYFARRWGLETTILIAAVASGIRWFWYSTAPTTTMVIAMFFIQGLSVGFYLATAAQFVRENTPSSLQVTALTLYSSMGLGLGSMFCNLVGGVIKDTYGILHTYTFFGIATMIGLVPLLLIKLRTKAKITEMQ
ncbi:MFS transporter [Brevibacillus fluminis]|uniref:MFS transporter n=1 Tax=Brevibacillus fluminis TaxID=511487 RepID=A0A3M8DD29_9BACL|nr:MFS transporter [Brevibacillus fluminis]RNB85913.1 MFS transporter [Brevibacillus fluminis]